MRISTHYQDKKRFVRGKQKAERIEWILWADFIRFFARACCQDFSPIMRSVEGKLPRDTAAICTCESVLFVGKYARPRTSAGPSRRTSLCMPISYHPTSTTCKKRCYLLRKGNLSLSLALTDSVTCQPRREKARQWTSQRVCAAESFNASAATRRRVLQRNSCSTSCS